MPALLTLVCVGVLAIGATGQGPKKDELPKVVTYVNHVEPILFKRCIVCHSGSIKEGKLDMLTYDALLKRGKSGAPIKPGNAEESILYQAMARTRGVGMQPRPMPPEGEPPVTAEELALVKRWIDQGAKAPTVNRRDIP